VSVKLYMDVHVRRAITVGLRLRGVDALTAQEDGAARLAVLTELPTWGECSSHRITICCARPDEGKSVGSILPVSSMRTNSGRLSASVLKTWSCLPKQTNQLTSSTGSSTYR